MKKIKGLLVALLMMIVTFGAVVFSACQDDENMTISLSANHLEIIIGENESSASLRAVVKDASDDTINVKYDSSDLQIKTSYLGDGVTQINVVAYRKCNNVEVTVEGLKKSAVFTVSATLPISSIEAKQSFYTLEYNYQEGGILNLDSSLFNILPQETSQTDLNFSLSTSSQISGVSIQNNKLKLEPNLNTIPDEISVEVVSAYKDNVKTTIRVAVIKAIDISQVKLCDESGRELEENSSFNIARNNQATSVLTLQVRVPYTVTSNELDVIPTFMYGDTGIRLNRSWSTKDDRNSCYIYTFEFGLTSENGKTGLDKIWFVLSYKDYPSAKFSTKEKSNGIVSVTTYDEITNISVNSNGTIVNVENDLNIYTAYVVANGQIAGMPLTIEAVPTTATSGKLSLNINIQDTNNNYLQIKNSSGSLVEFENGKYLFNSGETFYFSVKQSGFEPGSGIDIQVLSEENHEIQKTLKFKFNESVTTLGFLNETGEETYLESTRNYYLSKEGEFNTTTIKVALSPISIDLRLAIVKADNNIFEIGNITESGTFENATVYNIPITAKNAGSGEFTLEFESGQKISASVTVVKELSDVSVKVEPTFNLASSIGDISYVDNSIYYIAVKNGQNIPLIFDGNSDILLSSFTFYDKLYDPNYDDLYDQESDYNVFDDYVPSETFFGNSSDVISANYLRASKLISPMRVGKVWVKAVFLGKKVVRQDEGVENLLQDALIEENFLVEVYNPITSITLSTRNVELYAYDEVGEDNKNLTKQIVTIYLNKNGVAPTYNRIEIKDLVATDGVYEYSQGAGKVNFTIKSLLNNQFEFTALTRNDDGTDIIADDEFLNAAISFVAKDLNIERNKMTSELVVSIKEPILVDSIEVTNVPESGIYLQTRDLTDNLDLLSFRILTQVTPLDALNKGVIYRFVPDNGTASDIITISEDGFVTTPQQSHFGGSGTIYVIPKDSVFVDENGHEYYRENYVCSQIRILVADGTTKERAIRISGENALSQINNPSLHYMLMNDVQTSTGNIISGIFSGGLYGKPENSIKTNSITIFGGASLFDTLSSDAIIEDLYVYGYVEDSGMIAKINKGTINNVIIDTYSANGLKISKVSNNAGNAGGICEINQGIISNCTFSGIVEGTEKVGGLVAINEGDIVSSCVLLYQVYQDNSKYMYISGNLVGGIAGVLTGTGTIKSSYIYNYANNEVISSNSSDGAGAGALVGDLASNSVKIEQCFAEVGSISEFYAQKSAERDAKSLIKDSYVLSKNDDQVYFKYFMTNQVNVVLSDLDANQNYNNMVFGPRYVWSNSQSRNYGYPYLTNVTPVQALTSEDLENIQIVDSRLSLKQEDNFAVMYVYKVKDTITSAEKSALDNYNTISFSELFGITKTNGIIVEIPSEYLNLLTVVGSNIQIKKAGVAKITISSKYDRSIAPKEINITILQYTSNFALSYAGQVLSYQSEIGIRTHSNDTIQSVVKNTIVLTNRQLELEIPNYNVVFEKNGEVSEYIIGDTLGNHTILSDFEGDQLKLDVYLKLDGQNEIINKIIKDNSTINITFIKIYGPISLQVSKTSAKIAPSDNLTVNISALFDSDYLYKEVVGKVLDSNNMPTTAISLSELDIVDVIFNEQERTALYKYEMTISVNSTVKNFDPNGYTVVLSVKESSMLFAYIHLDILDQDILKIDINNYAFRDTNENSSMNVNYYPNNVLSPGTSGLLDIVIYPEYATYTHLTVTAQSVNGKSINLIGMKKAENGGYDIDQTEVVDDFGHNISYIPNFEFIQDGVKLYSKDFNDSEIGRYYVRAVVPSSVDVNSVFTIVVKVYNGEVLKYTQEYSLVIVPQEKAGIYVDNSTNTFAVIGQTIFADIIYEQSQTLSENNINIYQKDTDNEANGVSGHLLDGETVPYATKYYKARYKIEIADNTNVEDFEVRVVTTRFVNGIEERTKPSVLVVYVIPFDLDMSTTHVSTPDAGNQIVGDRFFDHELEFDIGGIFVKSIKEEISESEKEFNRFITNRWYSSADAKFKINQANTTTWIENLYYVNGNSTTPVVVKLPDGSYKQTVEDDPNSILESIEPQVRYVLDEDGLPYTTEETGKLVFRGKNNGTQNMVLSIPVLMPDGLTRVYNYRFTIKIADPTSDDAPDSISSAQEFLQALNGETEEDYILTNDLYLYDYEVPEDTSKIRSLDGNGYQIVINSFAENENTEKNYALFRTVSESTTLKNLLINIYYIDGVNVTGATSVNFAPVAITNNGIITNTQVVSYKGRRVSEYTPRISGINIYADSTLNIEAKTAGFVLDNLGSITNSSVGGEYVDEYKYTDSSATKQSVKLTPFVISAFGEISGFVNSNSGHIVSSYASNLRIINNSNTDYTTITSGFVKNNTGYISMSYSKGVKQNDTEVHATLYGVETSGISAGFVYENSGEVNNSYSNITLTNVGNNPGRNSAGFVYKNSGSILKSLSLSRIVGATTTQMNFAGVDDKGNYLNTGNIETSYYYDQVAYEDSTITIESAYGKSATVLNSVTDKEQYYGFSFSRSTNANSVDGIWTMNSNGPDLVSPLIRSVSLRIASDMDQNIYNYVDEYAYGSINNPILIRTAEEFNRVFSGTDNSSASKYIDVQNGYAFGNYRLINNIDLSELVDEMSSQDTYRLSSTRMTLTGAYQNLTNGKSAGKFDGNGFTISGLALSDTNSTNVVTNFGMFKSITSNATFMNVNIILGSTNSEGDIFGVEAKNVEYVGALAGTVKDSIVVNVSLKSIYDNTNKVTVRGKNVVGGIIGRVVGDSYIFNLSANDISVTAVMYPANFVGNDYLSYNSYSRTSDSINSEMSYAGGIIGVMDYYTQDDVNNYRFTESLHVTNGDAMMLKVTGVSQISAGTVGGAIGYVGPLTTIQDVLYELKKVDDHSMQGIYSYNGFAGGVVGINKGMLRQIRSEHEYAWQIGKDDQIDDSIEDFIDDYYKASTNEERNAIDRGNEVLFQNSGYTPIGIGGLVGLEYSGKILKSYSKLNVISDYAKYAGGIIGVNQGNNTSQDSSDSSNASTFIRLELEEVYASGDVRARASEGSTGGIFGFGNGDGQDGRLVKLEKVNAVNYWGDWIIDCPNTVYEIGNNESIFGDTIETAGLTKTNIVFAGTPITTTNSNYVDYVDVQSITSLSAITGVGDDGVLFDSYFFGNDWDPESWQRDENELYPHILFGYSSRVIRIRHQDDFDKLRNSEYGNIYIIDPIDEYEPAGKEVPEWKSQVDEARKIKWISITKQIIPIQNFKGTLRAADSRYTYKLQFHVEPTRSLFKKAKPGAIFRDFEVEFDTVLEGSNATSLLVEESQSTKFENLKFTNIKMHPQTSNNNVGIVCAKASDDTLFSNIEFMSCEVSVNADKNNVGLLFGYADLYNGSRDNAGVKSVTIRNSNVKLSGVATTQDRTDTSKFKRSNAGLIGGNIKGNHEIIITTDSATNADSENGVSQQNQNQTNDQNETNQVILDQGGGNIQANIGNLIGYADNIKFLGSKFSNLKLNSKATIKDSNIGAVVGKAENCVFEGIKIKPEIYFSKVDDNSKIGGIVGEALSSEIYDCSVKNPEGKTAIVIEDLGVGTYNYENYVGTIAGSYSGKISRGTYLTQSFADIYVTTNASNQGSIYVGSGFGGIESGISKTISDVVCYGNIISKTNGGDSIGVIVNIGGFAAKASGDFEHIAATGEIANVVLSKNKLGKESQFSNNINLRVSGLIAFASGEIDIKDSLSAGNIYPYAYVKIDENTNEVNILEFKKSIAPIDSSKLCEFYYGGLIGYGEEVNATLSNNNVISTLFNKNDRFIVNDSNKYKANAICGQCPASMLGENYNHYSHVYTLVTNNTTSSNIAKNIDYSTILGYINGTSGYWNSDDLAHYSEEKPESDDGLFARMGKLNPDKIDDTTTITWNSKKFGVDSTKYYTISDNYKGITDSSFSLVSSIVLSNGQAISIDDNSKNGPFESIDENSAVAGVVIYVNTRGTAFNNSAIFSAFVGENNGIVYSCNVRGTNNQIGKKITGKIENASVRISGFANVNNGLIKECYTNIDVVTNYGKGGQGQQSAYAGFVMTNNKDAIIESCYASGMIDNGEKSDNLAKINLFAGKDEGKTYNSYSIVKVKFVGDANSDSYSDFRSRVKLGIDISSSKGNFVDTFATEVYNDEATKTKHVAMAYDGSVDSEMKPMGQNLSRDITSAYGYPSFVDGQYKNVEYMHHATGKGTESDPYQVPNLGKLQQIQSGLSVTEKIYYSIVYDCNASAISSALAWVAKNVSNIHLNSYEDNNGENYTIRNLNIESNGGIFNELNSCHISYINLGNIAPKGTQTFVGLLANKAINCTIEYVKVTTGVYNHNLTDNLLASSTGDYKGCIFFGGLIGGLIGGEISNCDISEDLKLSGNTNLLMPIAKKNANSYIIGGIVAYTGDITEGAIQSPKITNVHISNSLIVGFQNDSGYAWSNCNPGESTEKTFIVGGIVGLMQGNCEIQVASVRRNVDVLTKSFSSSGNQLNVDEKNVNTNFNITLYAGGIVGACGQIGDNQLIQHQDGKTQTISNCYVYDKCIIQAGNHYACKETYVGGISGYGGSIDNCYNMAASVTSQAKYEIINTSYGWTFDKAEVKSKQSVNGDTLSDNTEEIIKSSNVYVNMGKSYSAYTKLIFTQVEEKAHCAGIANNYTTVDKVINYCDKIKGGMQARRIHAYIDADTSQLHNRLLALDIVLPILSGLEIIIDALALIAWSPWGAFAFGLATSLYVFDIIMARGIINGAVTTINVYQFDQALYSLGSGAYYRNIEAQIKAGDYFGVKDFFDTVSYFANVIKRKNGILNNGDGNKLPFGKVDYQKNAESFTDILLSHLDYQKKQDGDWMGLTHKVIDGENGNKKHYLYTKQNILLTNKIYFDAIGQKEDGNHLSSTCYSRTNVYEEVKIDGYTRYSIHDSSDMYKNDWDSDPKNGKYNHLGILYSVKDNDLPGYYNDIPEAGPGWEGWGLNEQNGTWVTATSADIQTTSAEDMFAEGEGQSAKIVIDEENNKITITITDTADYNTAANIINKLPLCDSAPDNTIESIFKVQSDSDAYVKLDKIKAILQNNGYVDIIIKPAKGSDNTVTVLGRTLAGSEQVKFNGSIQGINSNTTIKIQVGKGLTGQHGLFGYSNDLTASNINLHYSADVNSVFIDKEECNFGGLVAINCGKLSVNNCNVTVNLKDYAEDEISKYSLNVGGFVGKTIEGSTTILSDANIIYSNFDLKNTGKNLQSKGIGGYIGKVEDGTLLVNISNSEAFINISSNSGNNIVGGIIGCIDGCDSVKLSNLKLNSNHNLENVNILNISVISTIKNSNAISGGIVGLLKDSSLELESIRLFSASDIKKGTYNSASPIIIKTEVTADAGADNVSVYAGGIAGYVDNSSFNFKKDIVIGNKYYTDGNNRTFIKAGLNSYPFATQAYAGDIVGNLAYTDVDIIDGSVTRKLTEQEINVGAIELADDDTIKLNIYSKSLAFANPQYSVDNLVNNGLKPQISPISSKQILVDIESMTMKFKVCDIEGNDSVIINENLVKAIKVDYFEYAPEISTDSLARVSYVNGEVVSLYNYQKVAYIIVSYIEHLGDDTWWYKENVYKLQIIGMMNEQGDYDIQNNAKLIHVVTNEYGSRDDIFGIQNAYKLYKFKSTDKANENGFKSGDGDYVNFFNYVSVFDIGKRNKDFVPAGDYTTYNEYNYVRQTDKEIETKYYKGGCFVINHEVSEVDIHRSYQRIFYDATVVDTSGITNPEDATDDNIGKDMRKIEGNYRKYNSILADTQDLQTKLIFNYELYNASEELINENNNYIITSFDTIYQNMDDNSRDTKAEVVKEQNGRLVPIKDEFKDDSVTTFSIKVGSDDSTIKEVNKNILDIKEGVDGIFDVTQDNSRLNSRLPKVYQYNSHAVEGLGKDISIVIVSTMEIQDSPELYIYKDYVFAKDSANLYYLGYVEYHLSREPINEQSAVRRNKLFFPTDYGSGAVLERYENHLKSLDQIQVVTASDFEQLINFSVEITIQTDYMLDFTSHKFVLREKVKKFTFTLKDIAFNSKGNAIVEFNMDVEGGDIFEEKQSTDYIRCLIDATNNIEDIYRILELNQEYGFNKPIQNVDDYDISLNDAFVVKHEYETHIKYDLFVPMYSDAGEIISFYVFDMTSEGVISDPIKYGTDGKCEHFDNELDVSDGIIVQWTNTSSATTIRYGINNNAIFNEYGYIQLAGNWTPNYVEATNQLHINESNGNSYVLCLESGVLKVLYYTYNTKFTDNDGTEIEYTVTESYEETKITITSDGIGSADIAECCGLFDFNEITGKERYPIVKFDQATEQMLENNEQSDNITYLKVSGEGTNEYIGQFDYNFANIMVKEISRFNYTVRVYWYGGKIVTNETRVNIYSSINDEIKLIKKDREVFTWAGSAYNNKILKEDDISIHNKDGFVVYMQLNFEDTNAKLMFDLQNGFQYDHDSGDRKLEICTSLYNQNIGYFTYKAYYYYGGLTKFVIDPDKVVIDVEDSTAEIVDIRPFNGGNGKNFAIKIQTENGYEYYTHNGYLITFINDPDAQGDGIINLTSATSFGAKAKSSNGYCSYIIYNKAIINDGTEHGTEVEECFYTRNMALDFENEITEFTDAIYEYSIHGSIYDDSGQPTGEEKTFNAIVSITRKVEGINNFTDVVHKQIYDEDDNLIEESTTNYTYNYSTEEMCRCIKGSVSSQITKILYNIDSNVDSYVTQICYQISGDIEDITIDAVFGIMS